MMLILPFWLLCLLNQANRVTTPERSQASSQHDAPKPITGVTVQVPGDGADAKAIIRLPAPGKVLDDVAARATLSDSAGDPKVTFTNRGMSTATSSSKFVYFEADVTDVPAVSFSRQRIATLVAGATTQMVFYTLTNQASQSAALTVTLAASDWSASDGSMPIAITTGDSPATSVQLDSGFTENSSRAPLSASAIQLCAFDADNQCGEVEVPAYSTKTAFLRRHGGWRAGVFGGKISVTALQYKTPATSNLTVYLSDKWHKWLGVLVVAASIFLCWWVKTWSGNRLARDQALLPVAALDTRLQAVSDVLAASSAHVGYGCPNLTAALAGWNGKLSESAIEQNYGLPGPSPSPLQKPGTISSDFTKFLGQADAAITVLQILANGIQRVQSLTASGQIPPPKAPVAAKAIDDAYRADLTSDNAAKAVTAAISAGTAASFSAESATAPESRPTFSSLMVEIRRLNTVAWLVLLAVSAIGTILLLVLKPGFGKFTDYLLCLTTAFGAPTLAGAAIPAQSVSTAVTSSSQPTSGSHPAKGL